MLVVCAGMMRSGSTVQRQIVSALLDYYHAGQTITPIDLQQFRDNYVRWAEYEKLVCYKIHQFVDLYALGQRVKVLSTVRNVNDVVVSSAHFEGRPIETILEAGSWRHSFWNFYQWKLNTPAAQFYVSHYQNLVDDLPKCVHQIGLFLGLPITLDASEEVAAQCSLTANMMRAAAGLPIGNAAFMAKRHIYTAGSHSNELTEEQIAYLQPWQTWWQETLDAYLI